MWSNYLLLTTTKTAFPRHKARQRCHSFSLLEAPKDVTAFDRRPRPRELTSTLPIQA